ncbi:MAG: cobalamin B12-binding domain-containing protein [Verrucomicrobia bacterium]|nr:cobalamin B12-binding domain-containing protein [Verrucomicrobiota bacterium]
MKSAFDFSSLQPLAVPGKLQPSDHASFEPQSSDSILANDSDVAKSMSKKVLLTSVCRPMGPQYGDASSVGYELLHRQVTRAQGLFSPRTVNVHFSLEYIAENLDAPTVVLQYPSKRELIRELKKGYDYIGVSFLMAVMHKMKETVALIRQYSPRSQIVLGGYGTVLKDEVLKPYADHICREEGVAFFRRLLGEPAVSMPYKHPLIVSWLKVFGWKVSGTGKIFAGLGCPNGCDFCCTSHFFSRKHIKLLPEGKDIYAVIERYLDMDPSLVFLILDEDFLLNKKRAMAFRDCVIKGGKTLSIFAFSSVKAISQYTVEEILEMGIDGFWIGYEGTRSNYAKQQGRPVSEILTEFREHGILALTSMIVGFDYQNQEVVAKELDGLMKLKPALAQFLIYGPVPGTPFYERIIRQNLLQDVYTKDMDLFYRRADGFRTMIKHPNLSPEAIEEIQRWCFQEDFQRLGPSIYRVLETRLLGCQKLRNSPNLLLRQKSAYLAKELRAAYPVFLAGRMLGPNAAVRRWIGDLQQRIHAELGPPTVTERFKSGLAVGAALWTALTLKLDLFQHPKLQRTAYRTPGSRWSAFDLWEEIQRKVSSPDFSIQVELQHARKQVWLRLEGALSSKDAEGLGQRIRDSLARSKSRLVLDLKRLHWDKVDDLRPLREKLTDYRSRIRLVLPKLSAAHPEIILLASMFHHYRG